MKRLTLLFTAIALFWAGIPAWSQSSPGESQIRVVHASPDAPPVDIYLDSNLVLEAIPYRGYSDYLSVSPGAHEVQVNLSGTTTPVLQQSFLFMEGTDYSILAIGRVEGSANGLRLVAVGDDLIDPSQGQFKVRVIHAAPSAPGVDVYFTSPYLALSGQTPFLTDVPFGAASLYASVPMGVYQGRVTLAGTKQVAISTGRLSFQRPQTVTIVALDPSKTDGPFETMILADKY